MHNIFFINVPYSIRGVGGNKIKNVPNFSVPISGRRVGVKGNKDNVLIFALVFF